MKKSEWSGSEAAATTVFAAASYRDLLYARIAEHRAERGYQKRLAEAAGCRPSYLSQVLHSHIHLTPDQAAGIAEFWQLSDDETDYFLGLVGSERSSSPVLRRHLAKRCSELRDKNRRISGRIDAATLDSEAEAAHYYTAWYAPAVHVLVGNKSLRSPSALSAHLKIPEPLLRKTLERLAAVGLIEATPTGFQPGTKSLHLSEESPFLSVYHANWRQIAIQRLQQRSNNEVHFTGLYALGSHEAQAIREMMVSVSTQSRSVAAAAVNEDKAVCVLCDFFPV